MRVKKMLAEYLQRRETKGNPVSYINPEEFFRKHLNSHLPSGAAGMAGASKRGLKNFVKVCDIITDLGRMGVISDVDDALDTFEEIFKRHFNY